MTVCAAGGLPIPDQPWHVPTDNGWGKVPMCEVHSIAVDLGRALDESDGVDPAEVEAQQEALRRLLALPCPQPRQEEAPAVPPVEMPAVPPLDAYIASASLRLAEQLEG